ncbi:MAG TPA: zf-HC2 domain-containing protein [Gemmatimonadales bacterium]|nr:zf-HC2 domain-containing protein [Gemmatimonadales bacterium]
MTDQWLDRLSEYLDGELTPSDRTACEAHLASCDACRSALADLRRVVGRARALDDRPPAVDLWPAVASRIGLAAAAGARPAVRRFSFTVPQLVAASVVLALVSGGSAWLVRPRPVARGARTATTTATPVMTNVGIAPMDARTSAAVAVLEQALERNRSRLDTGTVRVIEKNLGIIDRAIRDAQSALAADPANAYLNQHLAQETRRKLELLRQAATLASART